VAGAPTVASVIAGATTPEQVRANADATAAWSMTPEERAEIDAITTGQSMSWG
jgi:aryl-alcohol dehydrogenase-like predicted oxidoreductase